MQSGRQYLSFDFTAVDRNQECYQLNIVGNIKSENYPQDYGNNQPDCWILRAEPGMVSSKFTPHKKSNNNKLRVAFNNVIRGISKLLQQSTASSTLLCMQ